MNISEQAKSLLDAVLQGESDRALYMTCVLLRDQMSMELEDTWIEIASRIGAKPIMPFCETWFTILQELVTLIHKDQLHITEAILMTTMLYLLYHRNQEGGTHLRTFQNVATLRRQILEHFPEGATLSYSGQTLFRKIIPPSGADTFPFVQRILAGFMRMLEQKKVREVHQSLEYLSRKKINITLPFVWPTPSVEMAEKGDPIWFLWGMVLLYYSNHPHIANMFHLFRYQYKNSYKSLRLGLLWGVAHVLDDSVRLIWTKEERNILENVHALAPELWASVREEAETEDEAATGFEDIHPYQSKGKRNGKGAGGKAIGQDLQRLDVFYDLVPRGTLPSPCHGETGREDGPRKVVRLSGSKKSGHVPEEDISTQRHEEHTPHETHRADPRYRWIDLSTKRL